MGNVVRDIARVPGHEDCGALRIEGVNRAIRVVEGRGQVLQAEAGLDVVRWEFDQHAEGVAADKIGKSDATNERTVLVDELLKFGFQSVEIRHSHAFDTDFVLVVCIR